MASVFAFYNLVTLADSALVATDGGTAIATFQNIDYPLSNIRINSTVKEFRTKDGTLSATFVIDCQTPQAADSVFLVGNSVTGQLYVGSLTIKGSATNSAASWSAATAYTFSGSSFVDENEFFAYGALPTALNFRYYQITVTNPSGYVGFSNLFVGPKIEMNISLGHTMQRIDRTITQEGRYGQQYKDRIADQKTFTMASELLNLTERAELDSETIGGYRGMFDYCGTHKPVWFMLDTEEDTVHDKFLYSGYCYFDSRPGFAHVIGGLYNTQFTLVQVM